MKQQVFALVDCNNFFVSCERLFRPDLEHKPVVVLSSNDGCAVARSNEVKALGVPMGAPAFKYRDLFKQHSVVSFSANFELYGDISRRVTAVLTTVTPRLELYSIDEAFMDLSELGIRDYGAWGRAVKQAIWDWVGIPVSIGIAPSKTLAKAATNLAKKHPQHQGVYSFINKPLDDLAKMAVGDLWGIGWRLAPKIRGEGVTTALEFARLRPQHAQQLMGIQGRQMVAELNGVACYPLRYSDKPAQSIARTRTFGQDINDSDTLEAAIASFATQAAFRLRCSHQLTRRAQLFLATNRHKPNYSYVQREIQFRIPTADTGQLIMKLVELLHEIIDGDYTKYYRAGVVLHDFVPDGSLQIDLLGELQPKEHDKSVGRMTAVDDINERYGKGHIRFAAQELGNKWTPRHQLRSPRYVSNWDELPSLRPI